jgi:hypothetical protein
LVTIALGTAAEAQSVDRLAARLGNVELSVPRGYLKSWRPATPEQPATLELEILYPGLRQPTGDVMKELAARGVQPLQHVLTLRLRAGAAGDAQALLASLRGLSPEPLRPGPAELQMFRAYPTARSSVDVFVGAASDGAQLVIGCGQSCLVERTVDLGGHPSEWRLSFHRNRLEEWRAIDSETRVLIASFVVRP